MYIIIIPDIESQAAGARRGETAALSPWARGRSGFQPDVWFWYINSIIEILMQAT